MECTFGAPNGNKYHSFDSSPPAAFDFYNWLRRLKEIRLIR